jgi:hypothetical protein
MSAGAPGHPPRLAIVVRTLVSPAVGLRTGVDIDVDIYIDVGISRPERPQASADPDSRKRSA